LRDDAKGGNSAKVVVAFEDPLKVPFGGTDTEVVQSNVSFGKGILVRGILSLLSIGDDLGVFGIAVVYWTRLRCLGAAW